MSNLLRTLAVVLALTVVAGAQTKSPGAGPLLVLETVKGTIEIETYPEEAPKTVARIVEIRTWNASCWLSSLIFSTAGSSSRATARPRIGISLSMDSVGFTY